VTQGGTPELYRNQKDISAQKNENKEKTVLQKWKEMPQEGKLGQRGKRKFFNGPKGGKEGGE